MEIDNKKLIANYQKLKIEVLKIIDSDNDWYVPGEGVYFVDILDQLGKNADFDFYIKNKGYLWCKNIVKDVLREMEENDMVEERIFIENPDRGKIAYDLQEKGVEFLKKYM